MLIRDADPERDASACAAIYAPYVRETAVSFEGEPPTPAQMAERIAAATRTLECDEEAILLLLRRIVEPTGGSPLTGHLAIKGKHTKRGAPRP
jgi:hypothetical protein